VYLACNQAFAEYAGKDSPEDVVGLRDAELFDVETAEHFTSDDNRALTMNRPYILYEDVLDAAGSRRQFQTTKLKFTDAAGRLCLLGMSTDITDYMTTEQEREQAEAAYREVLGTSAVYESIVDALSRDYFNLFYVNLDTDEFIEYGYRTEEGHRSSENSGRDFFAASRRNALSLIYEEDQKDFLAAMDKEKMLESIRQHGTFLHVYRLMLGGVPTYVSMKATRIMGDEHHIIIGISNIDAQMKDRADAQRAREEQKAYRRFNALSGNVIVAYTVNLENEHYVEYRSSRDFEELGIAKTGDGFFQTAYENSIRTVHPKDQGLFHACFTREKVLEAIERSGVFVLDYRFLVQDLPTYVRLRVAMVEEDGKPYLIVGLFNVDAQIRHEREYAQQLDAVRRLANRDELTGVKNKHAYVDEEKQLNTQIEEQMEVAFAVVVCDLNELKKVNDQLGHSEGDRYIRKACAIICNVFKRSPVYRIGGDEFAVICQGSDYEHIEELMAELSAANAENKKIGDVQIACGMARYEGDRSVASVFERADQLMYINKARMKK
jgi:diguanylate cyclase (GGDEF)-like protein